MVFVIVFEFKGIRLFFVIVKNFDVVCSMNYHFIIFKKGNFSPWSVPMDDKGEVHLWHESGLGKFVLFIFLFLTFSS